MFTTDSRTETFLSQMGVEFKYTNSLSYSQLYENWTTDNLARPTAIREEAVLDYAALMEGGSPAPAPILSSSHTKTYSVLDGVQRLSAGKLAGCTQFPAYVVKCDSDDITMAIRVLSNSRLQGHAEPIEWTRRRAVEVLVLQRGLSVAEVARMGGWKQADVARTAGAVEWRDTVVGIGGPEMPDNMLEVLAQCVTKEDLAADAQPIAQFLHTVKKARLSKSDACPYIQDFFQPIAKASKRHGVYSARLQEFTDQPEIQARIHGRQIAHLSKDVCLRRNLRASVTILEEITETGEQLLNVDEFFQLLRKIEQQIHSLAKHNPKAAMAAVPADMWSTHAQD